MSDGALSRIADALATHSVRYILVGGAALELHGSAYRTEDIDLVYDRERENVQRLVDALRGLNPRLRAESAPEGIGMQWDVRTILNGENFTLTTDIGAVDILGTLSGGYTYASLVPFSELVRIGSRTIPLLTLEGLLATKRAAGRRKDAMAIPEIEALIEIERIRRETGE